MKKILRRRYHQAKNIFTVLLNGKDQLLVEDELMELKDLRAAAVEFLDNNGDGILYLL